MTDQKGFFEAKASDFGSIFSFLNKSSKEKIIRLQESIGDETSVTLLVIPKGVNIQAAEEHWSQWCKRSFAEYLVEFKEAKVIEVEDYYVKLAKPQCNKTSCDGFMG